MCDDSRHRLSILVSGFGGRPTPHYPAIPLPHLPHRVIIPLALGLDAGQRNYCMDTIPPSFSKTCIAILLPLASVSVYEMSASYRQMPSSPTAGKLLWP